MFASPQVRAIGVASLSKPEGIRLDGSAYRLQASAALGSRPAKQTQPPAGEAPHDGGDYKQGFALWSQHAVSMVQIPMSQANASPLTTDKRLRML